MHLSVTTQLYVIGAISSGGTLTKARSRHQHGNFDPNPLSIGGCRLITICCATLTSSPDNPTTSGCCSAEALIHSSGGTLDPRFTRYAIILKMISDPVLPNVMESPFTVASHDPFALAVSPHSPWELLEVAYRRLMASADMQNSATINYRMNNLRLTPFPHLAVHSRCQWGPHPPRAFSPDFRPPVPRCLR